jgi:23S rRNA pseudouridine2605 synthase
MERLQKVIAESGLTSRRKAEELIINGKVKVNGEIVRELGTKVSGNDEVIVNGKLLSKEEKVYYILNKPREVITSVKDEHNRKTVIDIIKDEERRIFPVGRLDYDTTGLVLLTNDGELANKLMHPSEEISKVYVAKIEGKLTPTEIMKLKSGIVVDKIKYQADRIKIKDEDENTSIVEVTIHEGKYHEVRKLFESINHDVLKLKREKLAFLDLKGLKSGEYRK